MEGSILLIFSENLLFWKGVTLVKLTMVMLNWFNIPRHKKHTTLVVPFLIIIQSTGLIVCSIIRALASGVLYKMSFYFINFNTSFYNILCKVKFIQSFCWLYSMPNLLIIQHLETLYLDGNYVKVVWKKT